MLTEGADVPNVQTVFITRQTTSSILMTQMIGRALRGEKVGGSSDANIVLFFDEWKRLIDWAEPEVGGTEDDKKTYVRGLYPLEYISIRLVEELSKFIDGIIDVPMEFKKICPIGWYKTEIVYADSDSNHESMEAFTEFVMLYEHTQAKFNAFLLYIYSTNLADEWSKEYLDNELVQPQIEQWIDLWFDYETDNMGNKLNSDLIKIVRHIAQNQSLPSYYSFEEREIYDLDKIAQKVLNFPSLKKYEYLSQEFSKPETLWKTFYKTSIRFETAVDAAIRSIIHRKKYGNEEDEIITIIDTPIIRELTEEEKKQIKKQYGYKCLCCGLIAKEDKLQIDHVLPFSMGGKTSLENSQTLCISCNKYKDNNEIDFRINVTQLKYPKKLDLSLPYTILNNKSLKIRIILTRIVNFFYHCKAVSKINLHFSTWEIHLYAGNNPAWLLQHKVELLKFIKNQLGYHVQDIKVTALDKS